jgi:hypothetical protein
LNIPADDDDDEEEEESSAWEIGSTGTKTVVVDDDASRLEKCFDESTVSPPRGESEDLGDACAALASLVVWMHESGEGSALMLPTMLLTALALPRFLDSSLTKLARGVEVSDNDDADAGEEQEEEGDEADRAWTMKARTEFR